MIQILAIVLELTGVAAQVTAVLFVSIHLDGATVAAERFPA